MNGCKRRNIRECMKDEKSPCPGAGGCCCCGKPAWGPVNIRMGWDSEGSNKIIMKDQHFHHQDHNCDQQDPTGRQIQQLYLDQHQGS